MHANNPVCHFEPLLNLLLCSERLRSLRLLAKKRSSYQCYHAVSAPYCSMYASAPPADWEGAHAPLLQAGAVNSSQQQQPPQQPTAVTVQPVVGVPVATRLFGEDAAFKYPQHPALDAGIKRGAWKDGACSCTKQCYPSCLSSTFCWGWFAIAPLVCSLPTLLILSFTASLCRSLLARPLCLLHSAPIVAPSLVLTLHMYSRALC
jgi:hypothetical protein